jgi:DNA repair protein RadC
MKVKELPLEDRPREKLLLRGPHNLSDAELIAILLRTGKKGQSVVSIAQEIISKEKNLVSLASKTPAALQNIGGIGKDKSATLSAAFEIARRILQQQKYLSNKKISTPKDIAEEFIPLLLNETKEQFIVVCLNTANKIIRKEVISIGNLNSSIVHPREVFKVAVENNAASIILIHNHPSGNPEPSKEDISITKKLVEAGKIMDIMIVDHIIIAGNSYTSFVDRRII